MAGFIIDLNLYGPFRSLKELKREIRSITEKRALYIARQKGSNKKGCDVSYIGITQQRDLGARFTGHHKLGAGGTAANFDDIWLGYLYRTPDPNTPSGAHDARLKALEDILISWFLPPHNDAGVDRTGQHEIGAGAHFSAHVYFHWWTKSANPRRRAGIGGFPKQINYSMNRSISQVNDFVEAIW